MVRVMEMSHPWDEYLRYILNPGGSPIQEQVAKTISILRVVLFVEHLLVLTETTTYLVVKMAPAVHEELRRKLNYGKVETSYMVMF